MRNLISPQGILVNEFNQEGKSILEIGSREVSNKSWIKEHFNKAQYVGFDYYAGGNVDVVGDAHSLSKYFNDKYDLIVSCACFEHFAMPWLVAHEISKLLKVGGAVFIDTHFSYSSHERPWHFFQFSDMALKVLFNEALGFECIEAGMSNPIVGRFSILAEENLRMKPVNGLYCNSKYYGRKVKEVSNFSWESLSLNDVVKNTKYPTT
jgi:hypothetical protein